MSLLSRLFGRHHDDRAPVRPLWHRIVEIAREPAWYAECGVADTVPGRFDMLTHVLALFVLRMEREDALHEASTRLTELFVEDMDGQMRQQGVGDLVVGKKIGTLMGALGGRIGTLRESLLQGEAALTAAVARNVTLTEGGKPECVAARLAGLAAQIEALPGERILAAEIAR